MTSGLIGRAIAAAQKRGRPTDRLSAHLARAIYRETRTMNLPRAPLIVPGEKAPRGKPTPLGPIAKRVAELKKRFPHLTATQAGRVELDALLERTAA